MPHAMAQHVQTRANLLFFVVFVLFLKSFWAPASLPSGQPASSASAPGRCQPAAGGTSGCPPPSASTHQGSKQEKNKIKGSGGAILIENGAAGSGVQAGRQRGRRQRRGGGAGSTQSVGTSELSARRRLPASTASRHTRHPMGLARNVVFFEEVSSRSSTLL